MTLLESGIVDSKPDIHELFSFYNSLYFNDALGACTLSWDTKRMTVSTGACYYQKGGGCQIRLSELLLKHRPTADLKNTLLHEMIHSYLWIKNKNKDHNDHGPSFRRLMEEINSSTVTDNQRPSGGYNITINHSFDEEVDNCKVHLGKCQFSGDLILRAMDMDPADDDCIEKLRDSELSRSDWHRHKTACSGSYSKTEEPPGCGDKQRNLKGNSDVIKPKAIDRFFPTASNKDGESSTPCDDPVTSNDHDESGFSRKRSRDRTGSIQTTGVGSTLVPQKKHMTTRPRTKTSEKQGFNYNVIIEWIGYYADEEGEEEMEPLNNKRTERRKKQKMAGSELLGDKKCDTGSSVSCYYSRKKGTTAMELNAAQDCKDLMASRMHVPCENPYIESPKKPSKADPFEVVELSDG